MWKIYFREVDRKGKVLFEGVLLKEYKTKGNATKLAKKLSDEHKDFEVIVAQDYPF
jgi:hypothetical protein